MTISITYGVDDADAGTSKEDTRKRVSEIQVQCHIVSQTASIWTKCKLSKTESHFAEWRAHKLVCQSADMSE